jgi:hypothetical protein
MRLVVHHAPPEGAAGPDGTPTEGDAKSMSDTSMSDTSMSDAIDP